MSIHTMRQVRLRFAAIDMRHAADTQHRIERKFLQQRGGLCFGGKLGKVELQPALARNARSRKRGATACFQRLHQLQSDLACRADDKRAWNILCCWGHGILNVPRTWRVNRSDFYKSIDAARRFDVRRPGRNDHGRILSLLKKLSSTKAASNLTDERNDSYPANHL